MRADYSRTRRRPKNHQQRVTTNHPAGRKSCVNMLDATSNSDSAPTPDADLPPLEGANCKPWARSAPRGGRLQRRRRCAPGGPIARSSARAQRADSGESPRPRQAARGSPDELEATIDEGDAGLDRRAVGRRLQRAVLGPPLKSTAIMQERMRKLVALPVLSADALSSVADSSSACPFLSSSELRPEHNLGRPPARANTAQCRALTKRRSGGLATTRCGMLATPSFPPAACLLASRRRDPIGPVSRFRVRQVGPTPQGERSVRAISREHVPGGPREV
jgi:hypothetical protein